METFLTSVKGKSPAPSSPGKDTLASTLLESEPRNPAGITLVRLQSTSKEKLEDEAAQREERIHKCIEAAIGDDLNLSKTLQRLEKREQMLDKKLMMIDNLKEKLGKKPCMLTKEEIRDVSKEQKEMEEAFRKKVEKQLDPIFANQKELIKNLPEKILNKKYKQVLLSFKESLRRKMIETEVEVKRDSEFSIPKLIKKKQSQKLKQMEEEFEETHAKSASESPKRKTK